MGDISINDVFITLPTDPHLISLHAYFDIPWSTALIASILVQPTRLSMTEV